MVFHFLQESIWENILMYFFNYQTGFHKLKFKFVTVEPFITCISQTIMMMVRL